MECRCRLDSLLNSLSQCCLTYRLLLAALKASPSFSPRYEQQGSVIRDLSVSHGHVQTTEDECLTLFRSLLEDTEAEVRTAAAKHVTEATKLFGPEKTKDIVSGHVLVAE